MQHVDKNNANVEANVNAIIDPYIRNGQFRYEALSKVDRVSLRSLLSAEQQHLCCYCMKHTTENLQTVEHVIPKSISPNEFGKAYKHLGRGLYKQNILHKSIYTLAAFPNNYPHPLAYGNLTMACEDCNDVKSDDLIRPLFFANPVDGISYNIKGEMELVQKDSLPEKLRGRINTDLFIMIRSIWRAFKRAGITIKEVESSNDEASRLSLLQRALSDIENKQTKIEIENRNGNRFTSNGTWREITSFSWFWTYYK